ncbi:MAG: hypothetical protein JNL67_00320 [Planctomycetaceae bacterium]|nr:hypothetical protein [Planctomycetaceae bacterium]
MEDDAPSPLSQYRRRATERVRRRIYVAMIIALAVFAGGILYWPLHAKRFRTYAEITLQMQEVRTTGAALSSSLSDRESRLQNIIRECLSEEVLADKIRQATLFNGGGVAQSQIADVRRHLAVGLTRDDRADSPIRWIQVIWTGNSSPGIQKFVDAISQEIASRAARDIRTDSIQLELEERIDQIARDNAQQEDQMRAVVGQVRQQIERQQLTLLALQQQIASLDSNEGHSGSGHSDSEQSAAAVATTESNQTMLDQVEVIKQQILNSDAHLLTLLRQQVINHFEVDHTDGLVQHIDRLIGDRQQMLAQLSSTLSEREQTSGGESIAATNGRSLVRTNPFVMASATINRTASTAVPTTELQATAGDLQLETIAGQIQELQAMLATAVRQKLPVIDLSSRLQNQAPSYRVLQVQPAQLSLPLDATPTQQWVLGLSLIAVMVGTAFSLQNTPESLARTLFKPNQLARFLGIDHLGTIRTSKPKPNFIDNLAKIAGRRVFQAAEVAVALAVGGVLMAIIWEPTLPGILMQHPLEGLCQAFWILMGR